MITNTEIEYKGNLYPNQIVDFKQETDKFYFTTENGVSFVISQKHRPSTPMPSSEKITAAMICDVRLLRHRFGPAYTRIASPIVMTPHFPSRSRQ